MKPAEPTAFAALNLAAMAPADVRRLMGACIAPRPVALISTLGPGGVVNAAPYSNFMGVATEPPLVAFAAGRRNGEEKDTVRNIRDNGAFVINVVPESLAEPMHRTAADYPRTRSEAEAVGLAILPSETIPVPRLEGSPIHMECHVYQIVEVGRPQPDHVLIVGEVLRLHVRADLLTPDGVDAAAWRPLGGIGDDYMRMGEIFRLPWPEVPAP